MIHPSGYQKNILQKGHHH